MPLPTWYRALRAFPGLAGGLFLVGFGIYLIVAPTSYSNPNNPKMVAYSNSIHPVVIGMGVVFAAFGLFLLYVGCRFYNRLPEGLREYSYEQLRLGQILAQEIIRLTKSDEYHSWSGKYQDGSELYVAAWSYYDRRESFLRRIKDLQYGLGESVSFERSQPGLEIDGVLHVPELRFYIDNFTGKADRHETVEQYQIVEEPPVLEGDDAEFLKFAIRESDAGEDVNWMRELTEPQFKLVRIPEDGETDIKELVAHHQFMKQMGLDKPSAEELQLAIDQLKAW